MLPLLLAVAGMAGVSMLNTFWNIAPSAMAFAFLLGLLSWRPQTVQALPEGESLWRPLAAGVALSLLMGVFAGREIAANRLFREGVRYAKREDHAGAVKFLQKAADMQIQQLTQQSLVGIWYQLGESLRQSGQLQASAVAYEKDLASNPWAPEVHNMLGANLGQLGRSAEAAEHLRQAVRLSPGYTSAQVNLGIAYATSNNLSMAAQAWQDALKSDPANADARAYLIKIKAVKP